MKKPLTATQKKNKYRAIQYTTFGSEFLCVVIPYIILAIVNWDTWFQSNNGVKIGLGFILALIIMCFGIFVILGSKERKSKITNGWLSLIVGWLAVAFTFMLLADIMKYIWQYMLWGSIGMISAFGLDLTSQHYRKKADMYKAAIDKVKKDTIVDEIKADIEKEFKKAEPTE